VKNKENIRKSIKAEIEIVPFPSGKAIYSNVWNFDVSKEAISVLIKNISVPKAKIWDLDIPNLYYCNVKITGEGIADSYQTRFGFRTFEAKSNEEGKQNYYLNGKRIRIRSAIDWGYYWQTGFYATDEMARKSVENAKAIGHNCISFHRRIGEPLVLKYADELGLLIYEEPGGNQGVDELVTPSWIMNTPQHKAYYTAFTAPEKFSRMVNRDRNHPSIIIWSIVNEQCTYDYIHKKIFEETWKADNSRMLVNQSGGHFGDASGYIPHMRPFEANPRLNYIDNHTVDSKNRFQETDLQSHKTENDSSIFYWGEVRCYTGPDNYYLLSKPKDNIGYDYKSWTELGLKTEQYFKQNDFSTDTYIKRPTDISIQAGRGLMYIDGRLGQAIQFSNASDGYAINGWSGSDQSLGDDFLSWYSAICDEGRNLKGPASDFSYWIRPLQIAIARQNGKYFNVGDTARFNLYLFNENKIVKGSYNLQINVKDGNGSYTDFYIEKTIEVKAGDYFTELLSENLPVILNGNWHAGYITIECKLLKNGKIITDGVEQVLLKNRNSFSNDLKGKSIAVFNWPEAEKALTESSTSFSNFGQNFNAQIILAGKVSDDETLKQMLKKVKAGAKLIVKFDSDWADLLFINKILKEKVSVWGGEQKGYWNGNGWGYLEKYIGNQAVPSVSCIGTNSWEVPSDPVGFEPFVSNYKKKSYGAFFSRPDKLMTLMGEISYGKGSIILAPSYPVDAENAFNDLLFFNMLK
jgi:beta-galactosidase